MHFLCGPDLDFSGRGSYTARSEKAVQRRVYTQENVCDTVSVSTFCTTLKGQYSCMLMCQWICGGWRWTRQSKLDLRNNAIIHYFIWSGNLCRNHEYWRTSSNLQATFCLWLPLSMLYIGTHPPHPPHPPHPNLSNGFWFSRWRFPSGKEEIIAFW